MSDVRDNIFSFLDDWYGRLNDIIEDLEEHGFEVLTSNAEWIDVSKDDKEYVLKLGGTERTITIDKIEMLNESLKPVTEGGIYPVAMAGGADDAFLKVVNEILGGNITEVNNLELIPALGFGGSGRYWYRASITLDEDTIINFISEESTPEAKRLLDAETLVINPYSDISIDCSANSVQYQDGTTLDALSDSDADMKTLDNESDVIGNAIISKLVEAEDKIIEVLKQYEDSDDDDYIDESLIPIKEWHDEDEWDDDELASIYGGDTAQSQKDIEEDYEDSYLWYGNYTAVSLNGTRVKDKSSLIKKVMFKFDSEDYDDAFNEFEAIIPEPYSDCKLLGKRIYGITTCKELKQNGFKMIDFDENGFATLQDEALEPIEEASHPKLGKKIKQLKGWKIYQGTTNDGEEIFRCFTPDDDRPMVGYEDWECETLEQAISWIENYDLEESLINIEEINIDEVEISKDEEDNRLEENSTIDLNKDKAKSAFDSLLLIFNGEDIKVIDEEHNDSFGDYYAHILYNDNYADFINDVRNNWSEENIAGEGIVFKDYTDFGLKQVSFEYENNNEEIINRINIYVQYNNDDDDELIVIEESVTNENEKLVFLHLDNIAELASNYEEIDKNTLGTLVRQLKDEIDALNKVYVEIFVGIKRYNL